jgi:NAD(P)-dependent dehydrogenase (short-subunit alcohol dehydrogenase family)
MRFDGKIVVISGASRGIGFGIAQGFAREGAQTVLAALSADNLALAARRVAEAGGRAPLTVAGDLRQIAACEALHRAVADRYGRCDVLVNNAGATRAGAFLAQPDAEWQDGFALKFFAGVRLSRLFWPMLKEAQGAVINIIGNAARIPDPEFLVGGSVNGAVMNFTKGLSGLGKRDGVSVNAILPGLTETDRVAALFEQRAAALRITPEEARRNALAKQDIRRLATPDDVAALALFLAGPEARQIQGTAIAVDGGATPGVH